MTPDPTRILDEIQARADAATEGPWTWAAHTTADGDEWAVFDGGDSAIAANRDGWAPDAAFIAAARTDRQTRLSVIASRLGSGSARAASRDARPERRPTGDTHQHPPVTV